MPDRDVKTIKDLIYYQYAKIIARAAFHSKNGIIAKRHNYGFIKKTLKQLQTGEKKWSDITREDKEFVQSEKECIYCGSKKDLTFEHIVPKTLHINSMCPTCAKLQGIHNMVWACQSCNSSKGTMGLYAYYEKTNPKIDEYFDILPLLLEKKYLKTIYSCHECAGTLDKAIDSESNVYLELDFKV